MNTNEEKIHAYLNGEMDDSDRQKFLAEVEADAGLKQELEVQVEMDKMLKHATAPGMPQDVSDKIRSTAGAADTTAPSTHSLRPLILTIGLAAVLMIAALPAIWHRTQSEVEQSVVSIDRIQSAPEIEGSGLKVRQFNQDQSSPGGRDALVKTKKEKVRRSGDGAETKSILAATGKSNSSPQREDSKRGLRERQAQLRNHTRPGFIGDMDSDNAERPIGERYSHFQENPFQLVSASPLSTFSIDVDTASYSNIRRFLQGNRMPPADAVRIEEMINYFSYDYPQPTGDVPFSVNTELARCPWNPKHKLVHIGLNGKRIQQGRMPDKNLVFLIDVSGSMSSARKLPLLKQAFRLMVEQLGERDRVSIVVYAGRAGLVLPSTSCDNKQAIYDALDSLNSGGSTAGGAGINLAYKVAQENFINEGVNRVILATDGDFNVGASNVGGVEKLVEEKRKTGVFFSVLGFGGGNYRDDMMKTLAKNGNGNYAYIDSLDEAKKALVTDLDGTLVTIAKDVKIQVEFNPVEVTAYRLVGYESRLLKAEDFKDDKKDAGEIGAGHTVTALYEIVPQGVEIEIPGVDELKYQNKNLTHQAGTGEMMTVKLRYKYPDGDKSREIAYPVRDNSFGVERASDNFGFSSAVATFGMLLRDSAYKGDANYGLVLEIAKSSLGEDKHSYRAEFITLVEKAAALNKDK
ncbi:von Willebrand factor type A domain-containing protein [Planctomycetota bacterium]